MKTFTKKALIIFILAFLFTLIANPIFQVGDNYKTTNENMVLYDLDFPLTPLNNHSLREIFEDTSMLEGLQLLSNPDFSDGTTGWTALNTNISESGGILSATQTVSDAGGFSQSFSFTSGIKYYHVTRVRVTNAIAISIRILYLPSGAIIAQQNTPIENQWYLLSNVTTAGASQTSLYIRQGYATGGDALGKVVQSDYVYQFNISTLITSQQHSPLYEDTFNNLSDAQIKAQMALWVEFPDQFLDFDDFGWYPTQFQLEYFYDIYTILLEMGF